MISDGRRVEGGVVVGDADLDMIRQVRNTGQLFRDQRQEA